MKLLPVVLVAAFVPVALAESPTPSPAPAKPTTSVPLNQWLLVRESSGRGMKKGGGVRLRLDGFDSAEGGKGSTNGATCAVADGELRCDNGLVAKWNGASELRVEMGPIVLTLVPASSAEASNFTKWVDDTNAQYAACTATAKCCGDSEGVLGEKCDLNKLLGDRSLATCRAGMEKLRTALSAKKLAAPASCR